MKTSNDKINLVNNKENRLMATFDEIYEKIKEYPTIILHRHTSPDPDAIGSQAGLARSLRLAFPDKKILCAGENDLD